MTPEDPANTFVELMGPEFGQFYWQLARRVATLSSVYADCAYLFGEGSKARVALLNRTASQFFWRVQQAFESELMLGICRLTDGESVGRKKNLTINGIPKLLSKQLGRPVEQIDQLVRVANDRAVFARQWRNAVLAHVDVDLVLNHGDARHMPHASLGLINAVLDAVDNVLNAVMSEFNLESRGFRHVVERGTAPSLISVLDEGLLARDARIERARAGNSTNDDMAFYERRVW